MVLSVFPELLIRSLNIKPNGAFIIARGLLPRYIDIVSMYISKRHVLARANAGYTYTHGSWPFSSYKRMYNSRYRPAVSHFDILAFSFRPSFLRKLEKTFFLPLSFFCSLFFFFSYLFQFAMK